MSSGRFGPKVNQKWLYEAGKGAHHIRATVSVTAIPMDGVALVTVQSIQQKEFQNDTQIGALLTVDFRDLSRQI